MTTLFAPVSLYRMKNQDEHSVYWCRWVEGTHNSSILVHTGMCVRIRKCGESTDVNDVGMDRRRGVESTRVCKGREFFGGSFRWVLGGAFKERVGYQLENSTHLSKWIMSYDTLPEGKHRIIKN